MCAGKLLSLIKKCLHREKNGQKSSGEGSASPKSGRGCVPGGKKKGSPMPGGYCSVCHQQTAQGAQAPSRSGYHRLCTSPGSTSTMSDRPPTGGYYVGNPVVFVQGTPMDALIQRERQIRIHQIQTDTELNLPPAIPISEDGEEGYLRSQKLLQQHASSCDTARRDRFRPPPNMSVLPGDSPPPCRSNSVSQLEGGRRMPPPPLAVTQRLSCSSNTSSPGVAPRCHSPSTRCHSPGDSAPRCNSMSTSDRRAYSTTGHTVLPPCGMIPTCYHGPHGTTCSHQLHYPPPGGSMTSHMPTNSSHSNSTGCHGNLPVHSIVAPSGDTLNSQSASGIVVPSDSKV